MNKQKIIETALHISTLPERALYLALRGHERQLDKQGKPYAWHVVRVGMMFDSDEGKIVGFLHDLIEDTDFTIGDLIELGFNETCINVISLLTKDKNQKYDDYLLKISKNDLACEVKLADMMDNLSRVDKIKDLNIQVRLGRKYSQGILTLTDLRKQNVATTQLS